MGRGLAGTSVGEERAERHGVLHPLQDARVRGQRDDRVGEHAQAPLSCRRVFPEERVHRGEHLACGGKVDEVLLLNGVMH